MTPAPPTGPDGRTLKKGNTVASGTGGGGGDGETMQTRNGGNGNGAGGAERDQRISSGGEELMLTARASYSGRPLMSTNRCNKSCDWLATPPPLAVGVEQAGEDNFRSNPIAQVSSDILRAQGYSQQFKSLLSSGPRSTSTTSTTASVAATTTNAPVDRRDSAPSRKGTENAAEAERITAATAAAKTQRGAISEQHSIEERCNGDVLHSSSIGAGLGGGGTFTAAGAAAIPAASCLVGTTKIASNVNIFASSSSSAAPAADGCCSSTVLPPNDIISSSAPPPPPLPPILRSSGSTTDVPMPITTTGATIVIGNAASGGGGGPTPVTKTLEWDLGVEDHYRRGSMDNNKQQQMERDRQTAAHRQLLRRRQSGYGISITTESQAKMRCKLRKLYFLKRNKICDLSLALALIGLAFVVLDQELTALHVVSKRAIPSLLLRSACVASTLALIASLINYHRTEVKIALIDSGADDWRVALTTDRVIKLMIEICICAVCPFPGSGYISWPYISADERRFTMVSVPLDVLLAVPMFLRAYLLCRFMVLHSRQFQDAATRSIASLNRISMDFRFVIKTMMADHPMTVLIIFTVCYWICMSWMFTQCERYNGRYSGTEYYYMNSLWFIMVTFMSIGYGDVVPTSYCGRFLSITTGIVGAGVSSALIAVISRKLELSRAEKHVNNFMADSKLTNARKNAAAAVLQHTWFIHKYQQRNGHKGDELRLRQHQRKFLNAINEFRRIKWDQRKLQEKGNSLLDVGKLHSEMHETLWEMHRTQDQFAGMIELLTQRIAELQQAMLNATMFQQQFGGGGGMQTGGTENGANLLQQPQQLATPMNAFNNSNNNNGNSSSNAATVALNRVMMMPAAAATSPFPPQSSAATMTAFSGTAAQLRVPVPVGGAPANFVATHHYNQPIRKYSAVHTPTTFHSQQQQSNFGNCAPHAIVTTTATAHYRSPPQPKNRMSPLNKPVIVDGFGPTGGSNLGLTNSCSSPCLQKSQQQMQNEQQQAAQCRAMRILATDEDEECTPLMGDDGIAAATGGGADEMMLA